VLGTSRGNLQFLYFCSIDRLEKSLVRREVSIRSSRSTELMGTSDLPDSAEMWRRVTVNASAQLVRRVATEDALDACV
jgi:hypothetical protein